MIKLICFVLKGRFGHFLRAETGVSALSYPIPPRTCIIGLLGAVLGLHKDKPQEVLEPAYIALAGKCPVTHWHKVKLRKDPPEVLPRTVNKNQKIDKNTKDEEATLINQEWLFNPEYKIWVGLPEPYHTQLERRLKERRWYFQPCMGLSEMLADLEYIESVEAKELPNGQYDVCSIIKYDGINLDVSQVYNEKISVQMLKMPRQVDNQRVFSHASYIMESKSNPIPVKVDGKSGKVFEVGREVLMFL